MAVSLIDDPVPDGAMGEGIAIDAAGNLYTAEATGARVHHLSGKPYNSKSPKDPEVVSVHRKSEARHVEA